MQRSVTASAPTAAINAIRTCLQNERPGTLLSDATGRPADYGDERFFADKDPVPAVRELREHGRVTSVPETRLS